MAVTTREGIKPFPGRLNQARPLEGQEGMNIMAAKKETTILDEEQTATGAEAPVNEWELTKEVIVPRKAKGDDQSWFVCVNDRRFAVPANGRRQILPLPVAEVLEKAVEAEYAAEDFAEGLGIQSMNQEG